MVGERVPSPETKAMPSRMMNATESSRAVLPRTLRVTVLKNVFFMGNPGAEKFAFPLYLSAGKKKRIYAASSCYSCIKGLKMLQNLKIQRKKANTR